MSKSDGLLEPISYKKYLEIKKKLEAAELKHHLNKGDELLEDDGQIEYEFGKAIMREVKFIDNLIF